MDDQDILDRRDVQSILFDRNSSYSQYSSDPVFRLEMMGRNDALSVEAYYLNRPYTYINTQWGASYKAVGQEHPVSLKAVFLLSWNRYFIQPYAGVDAGLTFLSKTERNLFSHVVVGLDLQSTPTFGFSARETWTFPNNSFHIGQPISLRLENAKFEVVFYWQI